MAFGPSGRGARRGAMYAIEQQQEGLRRAEGAVNSGYDTASNLYDDARGRIAPVYSQGLAGMQAYGDRAGINGAEGQQRAMDGFNGSVYGRSGEDYGVNAAMRRAANMGSLGSGQTFAALQDFASRNRADNYSKYAALASPYLSLASTSAGQMAGLDGQEAGMASQRGSQLANLYTNAYNNIGQAGGAAFAASDQTRQQMTNLGMQGLGMLANGISAAAGGMGGFGGMGGGGMSGMGSMFSGLFGGRSSGTGGLY